jgi:hypothetical protein
MTPSPLRRKVQIILFCTAAAIVYGIIHDQITARLCVEYFSVAHPTIIATDSPTLLGLIWGVVATWWVGAALGFLLAQASQSEGPPPTPFRTIARRVVILLLVMAVCATAAGVTGYVLSTHSTITLSREYLRTIPFLHRHGFIADSFAHLASYLIGFLGGALLIFLTWRERGYPRVLQLTLSTTAGKIRLGIIALIAALALWHTIRN